MPLSNYGTVMSKNKIEYKIETNKHGPVDFIIKIYIEIADITSIT